MTDEQRNAELTRLFEQELDLLAERRVLDEHLAALKAELDRNRDRQIALMSDQLAADREALA